MRNISAASLATINTTKGIEPITIIKVFGNYYADKTVEGIPGKILQVGSVNDVADVSKTTSAQSVSIILDDTDGSLKQIFNNMDVHQAPCVIYQWFVGIPLSDMFPIFSGVIESPIVWKEGDRAFGFDVVTPTALLEVGFSPEEGDMGGFIPQELIGNPWPLVFGTVVQMPATRIDVVPHGTNGLFSSTGNVPHTLNPLGIHDPTLDPKMSQLGAQIQEAHDLMLQYFIDYLIASDAARRANELGPFDDISLGKGPFSSQAQHFLELGNEFQNKLATMTVDLANLKSKADGQKALELDKVELANAKNLVSGGPIAINVGGARYVGVLEGSTFHIQTREHPDAELVSGLPDSFIANKYQLTGFNAQQPVPGITTLITRNKFFYTDAGTPVNYDEIQPDSTLGQQIAKKLFPPIRYIVSVEMYAQVIQVYAFRTFTDGVRRLAKVPGRFYVVLDVDFGTLKTTMIYFAQPLSSFGQGWEDEIYATVKTDVGPNTVDIIQWIVEHYTSFTVDPVSFATVRAYVDPYPSHFAYLDRTNSITAISEIAFQARCALWIKNGIVYIKYLPVESAPTDTINESDVIFGSFQLTTTLTNDLVTKFVAEWKPSYIVNIRTVYTSYNGIRSYTLNSIIAKPYQIIVRYNVNKYGTRERKYNFYIYNIQQLVEKSATFWSIRMANMFKKISLEVPLTKLRIESFDTVNFNFTNNYVANTNINGLIEEATYDSDKNSVQILAWMPVRLGEMVKYDFAYPGDLTVEHIYPTEEDLNAGGKKGVKLPPSQPPLSGSDTNTASTSQDGQLRVTHRPFDWGTDPKNVIDNGNVKPNISTQIDSTVLTSVPRPKALSNYQYTQYDTQPKKVPEAFATVTVPGKVISGSGDTYSVYGYFEGLDNPPRKVDGVKQLDIDPDDTIPADTFCHLMQIAWTDGKGKQQVKHYIQVPIWV